MQFSIKKVIKFLSFPRGRSSGGAVPSSGATYGAGEFSLSDFGAQSWAAGGDDGPWLPEAP